MVSFQLLDLTLPSPAENLALDEALLEDLEESDHGPVLRLWESDCHFVVLGRSSNLTADIHVDVCRQDRVPILRRASGGGTVLQGPGCLSYACVLPIRLHADLRDIRLTNAFVLQRMASALSRWQPAVAVQGISDLTVEGRKISGNAQRRKRNALLFHGTILYQMHAQTIARYLQQPQKRPDYRGDRPHGEFLRTIEAPLQEIKQAIVHTWQAETELKRWPRTHLANAIVNVLERSAQATEEGTRVSPTSAPVVRT